MFNRFAIKLVTKLLNKSNLTLEDRNLLTTCVLDKLVALPICDIIKINEDGVLLINNRTVDLEKARILRESAIAVLGNQALKAVHDQVLFSAVVIGVHNVEKPEQMFFSRAAIWYAQQEVALLKTLAQQGGNVLEE